MKVIGTTKTGFILEAKDDEIANLIGYYSAYTVKSKSAIEPTSGLLPNGTTTVGTRKRKCLSRNVG